MPRRVRVINIDDLNQLDRERYSPFVDLLPIRSELEAQELLAQLSVPNRTPVDIFLVNIDMGENWRHHPVGLYWGPREEGVDTLLRPYGPVLAVPFLMSAAEMIFVPYSNWWASPAIYENGFVLLSCAFIFSRVYGGVWTLERTREHIRTRFRSKTENAAGQTPPVEFDQSDVTKPDSKTSLGENREADGSSLLQEPEKALRTGLVRLRQQLQKATGIQFVNVEATCQKLAALYETSQNYSVPLCDPDTGSPITIEWVSAHLRDEVEISSLCADVMDFRVDVDQKTIRRIAVLVQKEFVPLSIENYGTAYDLAKQALSACRHDASSPRRLDKVLDTMKQGIQTPLKPDEWQLIRRLAMLFAWVRAWKEELEPTKLITRVRYWLGFAPGHSGATNTYSRFIRSGDGSTAGKGRWNQPFKKNHKNGTVAEDFKLDIDQGEGLTVAECRLCRQFADEELKWQEDSPGVLRKYPRWMTEPNQKPRVS